MTHWFGPDEVEAEVAGAEVVGAPEAVEATGTVPCRSIFSTSCCSLDVSDGEAPKGSST